MVGGRRRASRHLRAAALLAATVLMLTACTSGIESGTTGDSAGSAPRSSGSADGQPAEDWLSFSATTLDGPELDVSTLAGEPVVLWFWAPWCTICRAEAPEVAQIAAELDGEVTVLGVPGLGPEEDMREFVADTQTASIGHLVDTDGSLWQRFGVVSQPAYVFIAPDGSAASFSGALGGDELRQRAKSLVDG
jgi:thiol-disulfide isomerase/thioredoxin